MFIKIVGLQLLCRTGGPDIRKEIPRGIFNRSTRYTQEVRNRRPACSSEVADYTLPTGAYLYSRTCQGKPVNMRTYCRVC